MHCDRFLIPFVLEANYTSDLPKKAYLACQYYISFRLSKPFYSAMCLSRFVRESAREIYARFSWIRAQNTLISLSRYGEFKDLRLNKDRTTIYNVF